MSAGYVVAVAGIVGTLLSPIIAQRLSRRGQLDAFEHQRVLAAEADDRSARRGLWEAKRAAYVAANGAARQYRISLLNYAVAVRRGVVPEEVRQRAEQARHAWVAQIAEVQMTASPAVLAELEAVSTPLSSGLKRIRNVEDGTPEPGWGIEEIHADLLAVIDRWGLLRRVMREDLGVEPF